MRLVQGDTAEVKMTRIEGESVCYVSLVCLCFVVLYDADTTRE